MNVKKTIIIIIAVIILVIAALVFLRFVIGGPEDTWICTQGQWVKHGDPSVSKPTSGCGNANTANQNVNAVNQNTNIVNLNSNTARQNINSVVNINGPVISNQNINGANVGGYGWGNVFVIVPKANDIVSSPLTVRGRAIAFENVVNIRLIKSNGTVLAETTAMTDSPEAGQWGNFQKDLTFTEPTSGQGTLTVFELSAKDGSEMNPVRITVLFGPQEVQP